MNAMQREKVDDVQFNSKKNRRLLALYGGNLPWLVMHCLRVAGPMQQAEVARTYSVSPATLCRAVRKLTAKGLLNHASESNCGPKRVPLTIRGERGYVVGVEYTAREIRVEVVDFSGKMFHSETIDVEVETPLELLNMLVGTVETLPEQLNLARGDLLGVAAVDCGVVDVHAGRAVASSLFPAWQEVPVREQLEEAWGVPVILTSTHSARLMAVDRVELGSEYDDVILLEYGAGIACGVKADGRILRGACGMAGEIGHTHVNGASTPCQCGSVGCLEAVAALPALARAGARDGEQLLIDAANEDKVAMRIVDEAFERIGTALGSLVNVLNPHIVVLPNVMALAGSHAVERLRWAVLQQVMPSHARNLEVRVSEMAEPVAPLGGALMVLDQLTQTILAEI